MNFFLKMINICIINQRFSNIDYGMHCAIRLSTDVTYSTTKFQLSWKSVKNRATG